MTMTQRGQPMYGWPKLSTQGTQTASQSAQRFFL